MNRKKSLKKLYGWISKNLVDTTKKSSQFAKNNYHEHNDYEESIKVSMHHILYKHNHNKKICGGSKSKINISYHKPKTKKIYFGSKTSKQNNGSKTNNKYKYYGNRDRSYNTNENIKKFIRQNRIF